MGVHESITKYKCSTCGKEWVYPYYHGGSIEHNNCTDDYNMNVAVNRTRSKNASSFAGLEYFFEQSINLDGNYCNIKDNTYKVGLEIFNCQILWLKKHGHNDLAEYLESREHEIKDYYNEITKHKINEKEKEIEDLKKDLIK